MEADGSNSRLLKTTEQGFDPPSWSPDGKKIAFSSGAPLQGAIRTANAAGGQIYIINADGTDTLIITDKPDNAQPQWSPDGKKIVFMSTRDTNPQIYIMNSDGSDQVRLTNNSAQDFYPMWIPSNEVTTTSSDQTQREGTNQQNENWDLAIAEYNQAIDRNPKYVAAYNNRGWAYNGKQEWDAAITDLNKAIDLDPKYATSYNNRGCAYIGKQQWDLALADLNKAIKLDPKYTIAYNNRGNANIGKQQWDMAITDLNKAIELDPKYDIAYTNRGRAYNGKKQWDTAIADFNKALEIDPKYAIAFNGRGWSYSGKNQWDTAIANFNTAIELDPKYTIAYSNRGRAYNGKKDWDLAIADFNKAIEIDPKYAPAYNGCGWAYGKKEQWDMAIADFNKAIEIDPQYAIAYDNRGWAYDNKEQWDTAIADFNKAIELDPKDASTYGDRGHAYSGKEQWDSAIADYSKQIELDPGDALAYCNRGYVYYKKQQLDAATGDFMKAIELDPKCDSAHLWLEWLYANNGYNTAVAAALDKAEVLANTRSTSSSTVTDAAMAVVANYIATNKKKPASSISALDTDELLKNVGKKVTVYGILTCVRPNNYQLTGTIVEKMESGYTWEGYVKVKLKNDTTSTTDTYAFFIPDYNEGEFANSDLRATPHFRVVVHPENLREFDNFATYYLLTEGRYYNGEIFIYKPFDKLINTKVYITGQIQTHFNAPAIFLESESEISY
ncbi:MAG: tetratricopeptide repeat protein [Chloroflexi bacterium]|nr:tetratricopeptide repeat protein [Chloroflexota bacterium]